MNLVCVAFVICSVNIINLDKICALYMLQTCPYIFGNICFCVCRQVCWCNVLGYGQKERGPLAYCYRVLIIQIITFHQITCFSYGYFKQENHSSKMYKSKLGGER